MTKKKIFLSVLLLAIAALAVSTHIQASTTDAADCSEIRTTEITNEFIPCQQPDDETADVWFHSKDGWSSEELELLESWKSDHRLCRAIFYYERDGEYRVQCAPRRVVDPNAPLIPQHRRMKL